MTPRGLTRAWFSVTMDDEDSGDDVNTPTDIVYKDDAIRLTDGNTTLQLEKASVQVENHGSPM